MQNESIGVKLANEVLAEEATLIFVKDVLQKFASAYWNGKKWDGKKPGYFKLEISHEAIQGLLTAHDMLQSKSLPTA